MGILNSSPLAFPYQLLPFRVLTFSNFIRLLFFNFCRILAHFILLFLGKYLFICFDEHGLIFLRRFVWIVLNWLRDIIYIAVEWTIIKGRKWWLDLNESVILRLRVKVLLSVFPFQQNVSILRLRKPVSLRYLLLRTARLNVFNLDQLNGSRGFGLNLQFSTGFDLNFTLFNAFHFNDVPLLYYYFLLFLLILTDKFLHFLGFCRWWQK